MRKNWIAYQPFVGLNGNKNGFDSSPVRSAITAAAEVLVTFHAITHLQRIKPVSAVQTLFTMSPLYTYTHLTSSNVRT